MTSLRLAIGELLCYNNSRNVLVLGAMMGVASRRMPRQGENGRNALSALGLTLAASVPPMAIQEWANPLFVYAR